MIKKNRRCFDDEFKARAVKMVVDGKRTAAEVARELNICYVSLLAWIKKHKATHMNLNHVCQCNMSMQAEQKRHLEDELLKTKAERDVYKSVVTSFSEAFKLKQGRLF